MNTADYFRHTRNEMLPFVPANPRRVLEIGCGDGGFSGQIAGADERWGIEPNGDAATTAASVLERVFTGTFEQRAAELPDHYFDVIICNDVIEHMTDHDAFLEGIKRKMAPSACLVISMPNIRHVSVLMELLFKRDFRYRDAGILDRTHLRFFTAKSLRRTLTEHGYSIESFRGINRTRLSRINVMRIVLLLLTALSFGLYWDAWFEQFAVRAKIERN